MPIDELFEKAMQAERLHRGQIETYLRNLVASGVPVEKIRVRRTVVSRKSEAEPDVVTYGTAVEVLP